MNGIKFGLGTLNPQVFQLTKDEFLGTYTAEYLKIINPAKSYDESISELEVLYAKYGVEKQVKTKKKEEVKEQE